MVQKPGITIPRNSSFTVICLKEDKIGIQGQIEHFLMSKGFNLRSSESAQAFVRKKESTKETAEGSEMEGEAVATRSMNSDFTIRFSYAAYYDLFYWAFNGFSGTVVDNRTGDIILSSSFSGDRSAKSVVKEFTTKLEGLMER